MTTGQKDSKALAKVYDHDLPTDCLTAARKIQRVAWDIETSGLDWRTDRIGTCQLYVPGETPVIVKVDEAVPQNLRSLLVDESITKLFHHAMFDLRFMSHQWDLVPSNIADTKIAAKLLHKDEQNGTNSLKYLLKRYLGISIDKGQQTSDWLANHLTEEQKNYAVSDVFYLFQLFETLSKRLASKHILELSHACFAHIPTRVQLEILGYGDVYVY
jgi:ribonuclease D